MRNVKSYGIFKLHISELGAFGKFFSPVRFPLINIDSLQNTQIKLISTQLTNGNLDLLAKSSLQEMQQSLLDFRKVSMLIDKKEENLRRFTAQVETLESSEKLSVDEQLHVHILRKRNKTTFWRSETA